MTYTLYVVPASRTPKGSARAEVPGSSSSIEGCCQTLDSANASLRHRVAESRVRRSPQTPRGGSAPGPQGGPAMGGGVVAAPSPVGPRGPL